MFNLTDITSAHPSLEFLVRTALTFGELSPGVEAAIDRVLDGNVLTDREVRLMAILQDAIANGDVKPVRVSHQALQTSAIYLQETEASFFSE
ncbi:MAG: hypothetical protein MJA27_29160 [Pseudanabaenales cyanobacterium]|nr:hypothetical protein [Pseudanabaenales cyanobacterium]